MEKLHTDNADNADKADNANKVRIERAEFVRLQPIVNFIYEVSQSSFSKMHPYLSTNTHRAGDSLKKKFENARIGKFQSSSQWLPDGLNPFNLRLFWSVPLKPFLLLLLLLFVFSICSHSGILHVHIYITLSYTLHKWINYIRYEFLKLLKSSTLFLVHFIAESK